MHKALKNLKISFSFQFDAEFRRFSVDRGKQAKFDEFYNVVAGIHFLKNIPFIITYTDIHGDLLPINNDDNFNLALSTAKPVLRINVQKKGKANFYLLLKIYLLLI